MSLSEKPVDAATSRVRILDILQRVWLDSALDSDGQRLQIDYLPTGVYWIAVVADNRAYEYFKVVRQ